MNSGNLKKNIGICGVKYHVSVLVFVNILHDDLLKISIQKLIEKEKLYQFNFVLGL